jgi:hypothetical protein
VTPGDLITAIVTDEGALRAPFGPALREAMTRRAARRQAVPGAAGEHALVDHGSAAAAAVTG